MATKKKTAAVTYKDVQVTYLAEGVDAVTKMKANPKTIRRAAKLLENIPRYKKKPALLDDLRALAPDAYHGRRAPKVGDKRDYKAQRIKTGAPFLRLPLSSLGVDQGQLVSVSFDDDGIHVTKKSVGTKTAAAKKATKGNGVQASA